MVGIINAGEYGRAVHDAWLRRQLIDIGEVVVNNAFGAGSRSWTGASRSSWRSSELFDLAAKGGNDGGLRHIRARADGRDPGGRAGVPPRGRACAACRTGLRDLDKKTGGLHPSDLMILAGRPGMGKTALATKIAFGAAHGAGAGGAVGDPERAAEGVGRGVLAGDECGAVGDAPAGGGGQGVRRPHPPRRDRAAGLRPLRAGQPGDRRAAAAHRRHAGHHPVRAPHPLPAAEAHQGAEPGGDRLPATDASQRRHQAGKPGAGDQPDHPGPEGHRQGAGGAGDGAVAAVAAPWRAGRTSGRSSPTCASPARSSRTPTW